MRYIFRGNLKVFFPSLFILFLTTICNRKQINIPDKLTDDEISSMIEKGSPLNGAKIPKDVKFRLGATHVAGKYYLTDEPYLIEGCKAIKIWDLGLLNYGFRGLVQHPIIHLIQNGI